MNGATYLVRAWIPDRPGALGQVASRIGGVRSDVVAIEILERGGGRAVDEIVVELPDASRLDMLIREINEVDGVDVEDVRLLVGGHVDPGLDALDAAAQLVAAATGPRDIAWAPLAAAKVALIVGRDGTEVTT